MNKEKTLISVIVPAYNCAGTITQSIESITGQTYQNIEILIIDDASSDDTYKKCQELSEKDERITVIRQEENKGVSAARNQGLDHAKGSYIAFCDADDTMDPDMLRILFDQMKKEKMDILCCAHSKSRNWPTKDETCLIRDKKEMIKSLNQYGGFVWNKLFDAEIIGNIRFDETLSLCEDTVFVTACLFHKKESAIAYIPQRLYNYQNGGVTNGASDRHFKNGCYLYETAMQAASKITHGQYEKYYKHCTFMLAVVEKDFNKRYHNLSKVNQEVLRSCLRRNRRGFLLDRDISFKRRVVTFGRYLFPYSKFLKR